MAVIAIVNSSNKSKVTVDSKKLEHGWRMIYADFPSFFGLGQLSGFYCSRVALLQP